MKYNQNQECVGSGKQAKKVCPGGKSHQLSNGVTWFSKMRIQDLNMGLNSMEDIEFSRQEQHGITGLKG